jgi:hypothetical protein
MEINDLLNIALACIIGYGAFVLTFFLLSKMLFPKVEMDEEYEKMIEAYQQKRSNARQRVARRRIKPEYFKLSRELKNRVEYVESI